MEALYHKPMEIESRSMAIIEENLTGVEIPESGIGDDAIAQAKACH